jgi:MraZ protein
LILQIILLCGNKLYGRQVKKMVLKSQGLTGWSQNKVDTKGRLSIPAAMRKVLAPNDYDEVVVVAVPQGNLLLFKSEYWKDTIQQNIIEKAEALGENVWRTMSRLSKNAHMSTVDSQGRITIPSRLLEQAAIEGEALVIGGSDRVFVWAPGRYDEWEAQEDADSVIRDLGII